MRRLLEGFRTRMAAVMVVAAVALGLLQVAPASADTTAITFAIGTGGLAIDNAETAVNLGTGSNTALGSLVSGSLGNVTVTDTRLLSVGWVASGSTTDFTHSNGTDTIPAALATISQGAAIVSGTNLTELIPPLLPPTGAGGVMGTAVTVGPNSATFAPGISILAPLTAPAGTYTGVFTSTVV